MIKEILIATTIFLPYQEFYVNTPKGNSVRAYKNDNELSKEKIDELKL